MIRLVVTDLDRTLLRDDGSISDHTAQIFKKVKEKGILVAIATGRSAVEAEYAVNRINADRYIITYTGAKVLDMAENSSIYEQFLEEKTAVKLLRLLSEYERIFCIVYASGRTLVLPGSFESMKDKTDHAEFFASAKKQLIDVSDPIQYIEQTHIGVNKIFVMNLPEEKIDEIWKRTVEDTDDVDMMITSPLGIDFLKKGVNKGKGLNALISHLGIRRDEVMIFGDSGNDLDMFQEGFFKVAVKNASPQIIARADYVTRTNNDDGVAYALEKLIL